MVDPVQLENQLHALWRVAEHATRSSAAGEQNLAPETELPTLFRTEPDRFVGLRPRPAGALAGRDGVQNSLLSPEQRHDVDQLAQSLRTQVGARLGPNAGADELMRAMLEYLRGIRSADSSLLQVLHDPEAIKAAQNLDPKAEPLFFELLLLAMSRAAQMRAEDRSTDMHEAKPEEVAEEAQKGEPKEDKYRRLARRLAQRAKRFIPDLIEPDADAAVADASPLENVEPLAPVAPIGKPRLKGPK